MTHSDGHRYRFPSAVARKGPAVSSECAHTWVTSFFNYGYASYMRGRYRNASGTWTWGTARVYLWDGTGNATVITNLTYNREFRHGMIVDGGAATSSWKF